MVQVWNNTEPVGSTTPFNQYGFSYGEQGGANRAIFYSNKSSGGPARVAFHSINTSTVATISTAYTQYDTVLSTITVAAAALGSSRTFNVSADGLYSSGTATLNSYTGQTVSAVLGNGGQGNPLTGSVGDTAVIDGVLGAVQQQEMQSWLSMKWGTVGTAQGTVLDTSTGGKTLTGAGSSVGLVAGNTAVSGSTALIDDRIYGSAGSDTITTAGADYVQAGLGNDKITIQDLNFRMVDGGLGTDTLALGSSFSSGQAINLTQLVSEYVTNARVANTFQKITGIERIDLSGAGNNALTLTAADVIALSDTQTLVIRGNAGDSLADLSTAGVWTKTITSTLMDPTTSSTFDAWLYTHTTDGAVDAKLWVETTLSVGNMADQTSHSLWPPHCSIPQPRKSSSRSVARGWTPPMTN
jgi:hypothetical protein